MMYLKDHFSEKKKAHSFIYECTEYLMQVKNLDGICISTSTDQLALLSDSRKRFSQENDQFGNA